VPAPGGGGAVPSGWKTIETDGISFSMPGNPDQNSMAAGGVNMKLYKFDLPGDVGGMAVIIVDLPQELRQLDPKQALKMALDGKGLMGNAGRGGSETRNRRETTVDGCPAEEFEMPQKGTVLVGKAFITNNKFFIAMTGHEKDPS